MGKVIPLPVEGHKAQRAGGKTGELQHNSKAVDHTVYVRRQWNDDRIGTVNLSMLRHLKWDRISGGVQMLTPQPFVHGYVYCDQVDGEIPHNCDRGGKPHSIKVCLVKMDNKQIWDLILQTVGPKPPF